MTDLASRVQLCGSFSVVVRDRDIGDRIPLGQARLLAGFLILNRDRAFDRSALIEALWEGREPASADRALAALLSRLRTCLGPEVLAPRGEVRLRLPEPAWVDIEVSREAAHRADAAVARQDWHTAWTASRTALNIALRPFFSGTSLSWIDRERRRHRDVRLRAWVAVGETALGMGGSELVSARRAAEEIIIEDPLSETGYRLAMRTSLARGNPAEAIAVYHDLRSRLGQELGVDPGPETRALLDQALEATRTPTRATNIGATTDTHDGTHNVHCQSKEKTMSWIVNCECGETVRAHDEDGVLEGVSQHVTDKHPDLVGTMSREDVLAMAERV